MRMLRIRNNYLRRWILVLVVIPAFLLAIALGFLFVLLEAFSVTVYRFVVVWRGLDNTPRKAYDKIVNRR